MYDYRSNQEQTHNVVNSDDEISPLICQYLKGMGMQVDKATKIIIVKQIRKSIDRRIGKQDAHNIEHRQQKYINRQRNQNINERPGLH